MSTGPRAAALAVVALAAATTAAGCGGSRQASCTIYDRSNTIYMVIRVRGTQQQEQQVPTQCLQASRRLSSTTGVFWSTYKGPADYSNDKLICAMRKTPSSGETDEVDINAPPRSAGGNRACAGLIAKGYTQIH